MVAILALYGKPADEQAFLRYYAATHAPLAAALPGLVSYTHGRVFAGSETSPSHWYAAHLTFKTPQALHAALESPRGTDTAADLANFATGGVELLFVEYGTGGTSSA